jgi:hypothetical protein
MQALNYEIKLLAPTDLIVIEQGHAALNNVLQELRNACSCGKLNRLNNSDFCDKEKISSCKGRITSFLRYGLYIVSEHFEHEENIFLETLHIN